MATVERFMRIAMIGSGYAGLVSGACLADFGQEVTCIDSNAEKIAALKRGEIPIYEPGLDQLLKDNVAAERMFFSTNLAEAVSKSDVCSPPLERPHAAATDTPISPMSTRSPARSPRHLIDLPSSPPSQPCRSEPATRSNASSVRSTPQPI